MLDAAGRLANQHTQSGKYVKKSILNRDYQYDGANQLINIKDSRKGELSYRYDPIGRLINAKGPLGEETFSFDPAHNILSKEHTASSTAHHQTENTLPSGLSKVMGNLLRHIAGSHFDYDQRGNLIKKESAKGIQTFDWDGFNQMKSSTFRGLGLSAGSRLDTQYRYDVFGRRIGKRVVDVRTKEVLEQTLYDWDGLTIASEDRIGEQLAVQAQIRKDAHSEKRKLSSEVQYLYEDGEFVPLVQYTNSAAVGLGYGSFGGGSGGAGSLGGGSKGVAPAIYHYVNDQIGTPQILMNADQEVVWEAQAKAWGDTIISAPVSDDGVINNHRFQGQYFDAESELHYNTFRYYDPEIGRYISLDPIGLLGGLNNYQYAPNPVEWVDPWGLVKYRRRRNGQFAKKPGPKPKSKANSKHGNSLTCQKTNYGYMLVDRNNPNKILKYGETINPKGRYSQAYLDMHNAKMKIMIKGDKKSIHLWQNMKILEYMSKHNGNRPPLNLSNW
ncbi:RHS domain-containing protein [Taylorella equigenitalis]|nr:RHS repeat-associated core domain-containing protein [Taylorella equigenitalis]WDU54328.1 RHS domain-containing protein [Taylorella equigenitalis]